MLTDCVTDWKATNITSNSGTARYRWEQAVGKGTSRYPRLDKYVQVLVVYQFLKLGGRRAPLNNPPKYIALNASQKMSAWWSELDEMKKYVASC